MDRIVPDCRRKSVCHLRPVQAETRWFKQKIQFYVMLFAVVTGLLILAKYVHDSPESVDQLPKPAVVQPAKPVS